MAIEGGGRQVVAERQPPSWQAKRREQRLGWRMPIGMPFVRERFLGP